jgi:hypothetical protein
MAPGPVFFLFSGRQAAKIAIGIAVVFARPLVVVDNFVMVPDVVVAVVGIIDLVVMMGAGRAQCGSRQGGGQKKRSDKTRRCVHLPSILLRRRVRNIDAENDRHCVRKMKRTDKETLEDRESFTENRERLDSGWV